MLLNPWDLVSWVAAACSIALLLGVTIVILCLMAVGLVAGMRTKATPGTVLIPSRGDR
ncbi:MAG TPA: hypothetical protein VIL55_01410 [Naasia sp.]|jgi:hypothetical protein